MKAWTSYNEQIRTVLKGHLHQTENMFPEWSQLPEVQAPDNGSWEALPSGGEGLRHAGSSLFPVPGTKLLKPVEFRKW